MPIDQDPNETPPAPETEAPDANGKIEGELSDEQMEKVSGGARPMTYD